MTETTEDNKDRYVAWFFKYAAKYYICPVCNQDGVPNSDWYYAEEWEEIKQHIKDNHSIEEIREAL